MPGMLQSIGRQRFGHDLVTEQQQGWLSEMVEEGFSEE